MFPISTHVYISMMIHCKHLPYKAYSEVVNPNIRKRPKTTLVQSMAMVKPHISDMTQCGGSGSARLISGGGGHSGDL